MSSTPRTPRTPRSAVEKTSSKKHQSGSQKDNRKDESDVEKDNGTPRTPRSAVKKTPSKKHQSGSRKDNKKDESETEVEHDNEDGHSQLDSSDVSEEDTQDRTFENLDPNETRRLITEMIDTCQELYDKQGFQENEDELVRKQVKQSKLIFEHQFAANSSSSRSRNTSQTMDSSSASMSFGSSSSPNNSQDQSDTNSTILARTHQQMIVASARPTDMYLTYKHTNICAGLVRKRAQLLGSDEKIISVDIYLNALLQLGKIDNLGINSRYRIIERRTDSSWNTAPDLNVMLGAFDHKEYLTKLTEEKPVKKEVVRVKKGKSFNATLLVTTQETLNLNQDSQEKSQTVEESSNEFRKSLSKFCQDKDNNSNIFEFALNKESTRDSLNNLFSVAFGVRDGYIALNRQDPEGNNIQLVPCIPPKKSDVDMGSRRQYIFSLSSADLRKMQAMARGENAIKHPPYASASRAHSEKI